MVVLLMAWGFQVPVDCTNVIGEELISFLVLLIEEKEDQVETREKGLG